MADPPPTFEPGDGLERIYVSAEALLQDAYRLAVKIYRSGFRPDFIVGLWRGGSEVGIAVQECLEYLGVSTDHIAVRTSYSGMTTYPEIAEGKRPIRVHGLQYLLENLNTDHALLLVDDVYGSGRSMQAVVDMLSRKARRNMPAELRIAVPWYKPSQNRTGRVPDFYVHETHCWLVMPYELTGLTREEIEAHKPGLAEILDRLS
ncbi:MAG: phosphoribosyltransferase [Gammaproteobacteria bacterium]